MCVELAPQPQGPARQVPVSGYCLWGSRGPSFLPSSDTRPRAGRMVETKPLTHSIRGGVGAPKVAAEDSASTPVDATYQIILTTQEVD